MEIAFLGTGEFGVAALRQLVAAGHRVVCAVSQPDRPSGRGLALTRTPIHAAADELSIPHIQSADINRDPVVSLIAECRMAVVAAFGQKLSAELLRSVPLGFVNIHGSVLPRYRGAAPVQWAVLNGDADTGVTVFQIDEKWDNGPIWGVQTTAIGATETADELHDRLAIMGAELIVECIARIERGSAAARAQDRTLATRAPKLSKRDGQVDWKLDAHQVTRRINGLWSWPAASAIFESARGMRERVQLARAECVSLEQRASSDACGHLDASGLVTTGAGQVRILEIKPTGGKLMPFDAFARGRDIRPPARFLPLESA